MPRILKNCRRILYQSAVTVVTDTTDHENRVSVGRGGFETICSN